MSYVTIWVHLVFATKYREPFLTKKLRYNVQKHIIANCVKKDIFLQAINGYTEHMHCLISLGKEQTIANVAKLIKGESSHWINENKLTKDEFHWQDDYYAVSISQSQVARVVKYIKNQEAHHAVKSFDDEVEEFMSKYGWTKLTDE